jgi:hypothetical protein
MGSDFKRLLSGYGKHRGIRQCVGPAEVFQELSRKALGLDFTAENFGHLRRCNIELQFPLPQDVWLSFSGDQVVGLDLDIHVLQRGAAR